MFSFCGGSEEPNISLVDEVGKDQDGKVVVKVNPEFFRPVETNALEGDTTLAQKELGWKPKTSFAELVQMMVEADVEQVKHDYKL